jgi:DnaJ-like protein
MTRRSPRPRAYAPDPDAPGRPCEMPGCLAAGEYRAPKSRSSLRDYYWFCLPHVREYNAKWDFYKGMSPGEIETQLRADTAWQRPTWPLGRLGSAGYGEEALRDPLDVLSAGRFRRGRGEWHPHTAAPTELREPLATLGLDWPVTLDEVKARYKALAKRHHPDANGGDRAAEERLKVINLAYAAVRRGLASEPGLAATG